MRRVGKGALAPCPPSPSVLSKVGTRSLSSGARSRDPLALPTLRHLYFAWGCFRGFALGQLMQSHLSRFPAEHRLLAGDAPVIAGQRAALAEGAMAGHHEG